MAERWKPEGYEEYWYLSTGIGIEVNCIKCNLCSSVEADYEAGNCFQTRKEAEAAAAKVKDLLLDLHKNPENLRKSEEPSQKLGALSELCETLDKEIEGTREVRDNLQKSVNMEATRLRTLEEVRCEVKMMMEAEEC
ncbi:hypothetical protein [Faecalibaculum rodentium]|uniref:hypothetical protein n=1 Tax=Faecalibaculum rodentium TaxID=1702221 RepID=UPI00272F0AE3|nr:hypothetical protein [Faecalibaculum rodentium]